MGNHYKFSAAVLLVAALAVSCEKIREGESAYAPEEIVLDASPDATKGFLSSDGLKVNGTQFQMYDYLSGYSGTIVDGNGISHDGAEYQYFGNTLTFKQDAANWQWLFGDVNAPTSYRWTRSGVHHFYGWLLEDKTSTDPDAGNLKSSTFFSTYTYTPDEKKLTVAKTFTSDDPQYDFLYSDVVAKNVAEGIPTSVAVPMNHLFGALGISVQNTSKTDVKVYSVSLQNFPNNHSETLTWDMTDGVSLVGGNPTVSGTFWPNKIPSAGITLKNIEDPEGKKTYDAYTGALMGENLSYRMCWPMTRAALKPTVTGTGADGNPTYSDDSPLVVVRAKVGSTAETTYTMRFPNADDDNPAITAGKKTQLSISFADKQVQLSFHTLPWDYEEYPMAFENDAVSATQLKFIEGTYTPGIPKLIDANGKHDVIQLTPSSTPAWVARGQFSVYTPVNGRLSVGLSGDIDSFIVTLESGNTYTGTGNDYILIDPNRDGGLITLGVRPRGVPASGKKLFLHFAVINNNRDTDADSEINRDNYVITIP